MSYFLLLYRLVLMYVALEHHLPDYGMVEGLMYARSEDDEHEETILQRPHSRQENLLPYPLPMPSSLQPSLLHHLRSSVPTNANVVHRWLYPQIRQDPGRACQISTMIIGIQRRAKCQCLPSSLSTQRPGLRQHHQYLNHARVPIRVVADRGWIRHAREGGFIPLKNGFCKVEAAFIRSTRHYRRF